MIKDSLDNSLLLIGFMGAGKTTIGKTLAKQMNRKFIDIDEEIESSFGLSATEIFERYGEPRFREKERELIAGCITKSELIISVGGGAFLDVQTREAALQACTVIHLAISWESWKERISDLVETRPNLRGKDINAMKQLFEERQNIYQANHIEIKTDNMGIEEAAATIIEKIEDRKG